MPLPPPSPGETWVTGAVVLDDRGRAFALRRSGHLRLYPGCWDIIGGHVEPGEPLLDALAREITEETGWRLRRVVRVLAEHTWDGRREVDVLAEVDGDLNAPRLAPGEHSAYAWFGPSDLPWLLENRAPGDTFIHDLIARAVSSKNG